MDKRSIGQRPQKLGQMNLVEKAGLVRLPSRVQWVHDMSSGETSARIIPIVISLTLKEVFCVFLCICLNSSMLLSSSYMRLKLDVLIYHGYTAHFMYGLRT
jgi:hypothetical protein